MRDNKPTTAFCPKCGFESPDMDVCTSCGALISKIRNREKNETQQENPKTVFSYPEAPRRSLTSIMVISIIVIAILALALNGMRKAGYFGEDASGTMVFSTFQDSFDGDVLQHSGSPVFVDFYADWCGACKILAPELEKLVQQYGAHVKVLKVNVDNSPELAQRYSVSILPTLVVFKNGAEAERIVGPRPVDELKKIVDRNS